MFENIIKFFKNIGKKEDKKQAQENSKDAAKERLHLVLMQDRANVSADFLELMKQEIIDVIKKYIEIDEKEIDVRLTNKENEDGTNGAPALYANIPILNIKNDARKIGKKEIEETTQEEKKQPEKEETKIEKNEIKEEKEEQKQEREEQKQEKEEQQEEQQDEQINEEKTETLENKEEEKKEVKSQEKVPKIIEEVIEKMDEKEEIKSEN